MTNATIKAAIDIGTNSILLLVARHSAQGSPGLVPLIDQAQTVRLGEHLLSTGLLSPQAIERTLHGLYEYVEPILFACNGYLDNVAAGLKH